MEIDDPKSSPNPALKEIPEGSQTSLMEEDSESLDLGELDLLGLEDACRRKEFDKINPRQIDTLEVVLSRAQQQKKLGIQLGRHWDSLKVIKESKKRGQKPDW